MRIVLRWDLATGSVERHPVDAGDRSSEPVFVPRPGGSAENDGWLLVCVYRGAGNTSEVRVLYAGNVAAPPLATEHLGQRPRVCQPAAARAIMPRGRTERCSRPSPG